MRKLLVLLSVIAWVAVVPNAYGSVYRYFGLKFGRLTQRLVLNSCLVTTGDSHVAVWTGVNGHGNSAWLQAGIEQMGWENKPNVYIETGRDGRQASFVRWPVDWNRVVTVKLRRRGHSWRVTVLWGTNRKQSQAVYIDTPSIDSTLEIFGRAKGVAHIGGHRVQGDTR